MTDFVVPIHYAARALTAEAAGDRALSAPRCPATMFFFIYTTLLSAPGVLGVLGVLGTLRVFLGLLIILGVLWESPDPAAVGLSYLFESDNLHLLSGATELLPGEPMHCTSHFDKGCWHRSVHQNVH
jgi:hypothetical protein